MSAFRFSKTPLALSFFLLCGVFALAQASDRLAESRWPLLPADSSAPEGQIWGRLENGLRYVILPLESAEEDVSLRLIVGAGRAQEPESLPGVSTVLADLVYQGTDNFARDTIAALAISNGLEPESANLSAVDLDHTVYRMELHRANAASFEAAVGFFADIATSPRFDAEVLERRKAYFQEVAKSPLTRFLPERAFIEDTVLKQDWYSKIGDERVAASLANISVENLEEYWSRWYTADRMIVAIVGGVQPENVETLVKSEFAKVRSSKEAKSSKERDLRFRDQGEVTSKTSTDAFGRLAINAVSRPLDLSTAEGEATFIKWDFIGRYAQELATSQKHIGASVTRVFGSRLALSLGNRFPFIRLQDEIMQADKVMHRLSEYGIRAEDLPAAKLEYLQLLTGYDVDLSAREFPRVVAERIVQSALTGIPFRYGKDLETFVKSVIEPLDFESVKALCQEIFPVKGLAFVVSLPDGFELPSKVIEKRLKAVRKGYDFTWEQAGEVQQQWDVGSGFSNGGIVKTTRMMTFGGYPVLQYEFENNLRLNLVKSEEFPGKASFYLSLGNGLAEMENANPAFGALIRSLLPKMKIGQGVQAPTMKEVLEAKGLEGVEVGINGGQLYWKAEGENEDHLVAFAQSLVVWMVTSIVDKETYDNEIEVLEQVAKANQSSSLLAEVDNALFKQDDRLRNFFDEDDLEGLSQDAFSKWLTHLRGTGYIEITAVGDLAPRTVLRDIRKTFGSAPVRTGKVIQPRHGKPAKWGEAGFENRTVKSSLEDGYVTVVWPQVESKSCEAEFRLRVLHSVFQEHARVQLADKPQLLSSLEVSLIGDPMAPGSAGIKLQVRCPASMESSASEAVLAIGESFAESLSADLLEASQRGLWVDQKRISYSAARLIELFKISQGRPNALGCVVDVIEKGVSHPFETYVELASEQFSRDNARGVSVMPKGK